MCRNGNAPDRSVSRLPKVMMVVAALCAGLTGEPAHADQAGAQIVVGDVTFIHDGYQTIIQASDGSIINY
ncbi:MAG: hypothetical protein GY715_07730, partial [Planctomycetes bacterium]|nr:hypothetical protein [Planctomycetota bacterium]